MTFPRYGAYKRLNAEWIGEVPSHWTHKPLWTLFRRTKRTGHEDEQLLSVYRDYGVVPKASRDDNFNKPSDDLTTYQLVEPGDLAINKMKAWQGSVAISEHRGIVSPAYFVFKAVHQEEPRFLHYLLRSAEYTAGYLSISKGIRPNQWDLEPQEHSRMPVLLPSIREQVAIASFLDRETGKIDALVEEQKRLIVLLKEKRQTVTSHAVTKGLDPDVPMKDSGIKWIGKVPEHWDVVRIKWAARMESGHTPDKKVAAYWENCTIPWVSLHDTGYLKEHDFITETAQFINELGVANSSARVLPERVVVFSRDATIGRCGITTRPMAVSQHFIAWVCSDRVKPEFLLRCLRSMSQELERLTFGATVKTIGMPDVRSLTFACPPIDEQEAIIERIRASNARLDALIEAADAAITLLQERRSALISAAVTGKIDVRGLVPEQAEAA
ncbi:restriction endonuclease subunit S [Microvirga arabica]|uniref:Restriction endonuclease subunit S n=1 Tax=Microvirga arabica TaxID=1128671 RepID=A0ABV6Y355_9HYPH